MRCMWSKNRLEIKTRKEEKKMPKCKNCNNLYNLSNKDDVIVGKWCPKINDSPHADRIRSMTDEELAEMLSTVSHHCVVYLSDKINCRHSSCDTGCKNNIRKWLQEESEE